MAIYGQPTALKRTTRVGARTPAPLQLTGPPSVCRYGPSPIPELLPTAEAQAQWDRLYRDLDAFADDWLSLALGILEGLPPTYAPPTARQAAQEQSNLLNMACDWWARPPTTGR